MRPLATRINGGARAYFRHARLFFSDTRVLIPILFFAVLDVLLIITIPSADMSFIPALILLEVVFFIMLEFMFFFIGSMSAPVKVRDTDNDKPLAERLDIAKTAAERATTKLDENEGKP